MNKELSSYFAKVKADITSQFGAAVFILLADASGRISRIWDNGQFIYQQDILEPIRKSGNIFSFFDLGPIKSLGDIETTGPRPKRFFPCKDVFRKSTVSGFYSRLPVCYININSAGDDAYLCIVRAQDSFPNIFSRYFNAILYIDRDDSLVGFNDAFFSFFKDKYPAPENLLGVSCGELFSLSPLQIQSDYFASYKKETRGFSSPSFRWNVGLEMPREIELNQLGTLSLSMAGLSFENTSSEERTLTLPRAVNVLSQDFLFELELSGIAGNLPCIILGDRPGQNISLDTYGYEWGTEGAHLIFLKKYGIRITETQYPHAFDSTGTSITLLKQQSAFILSINGRETLRYYDFELFQEEMKYVSLFLRPGSKCVLKKLALSVRDSRPGAGPKDIEVTLFTQPPKYMTFNCVYNDFLNNHEACRKISGYFLRDITVLKKDIARAEGLYEKEKRESRKLQALLHRSEEEPLLVGNSPVIEKIREKVAAVAGTDACVLIQGETGTGKEVLARTIHAQSRFSSGPFLKVDCSMLTPSLIESELFGHEKGAFTGAFQEKRGKFEQAQGGTLFIDEINNLDKSVQAKLLGFLQDHVITRVGGEQSVPLNLRVILASNVRLEELMRQGLFREDLFYRINVINITLPPLRNRVEDIPLLCDYFLQNYCAQYDKKIRGFSDEALRKLFRHPWPGNVRELKNVINSAVIFCNTREISPELLQLEAYPPMTETTRMTGPQLPRESAPKRKRLKHRSIEEIIAVVRKQDGNFHRAAEALGVTRQMLYHVFKKKGVSLASVRESR